MSTQTLNGIVVNGGIVLQPPQSLPEGAHVQVTVTDSTKRSSAETLAIFANLVERAKEHRRVHGGRTKEEIDADLAAQRQEDVDDAEALDLLHRRAIADSTARRPSEP